MQRRLVSSAATTSRFAVAPSSLPKFPPKASHTPPKDPFGSDEAAFDPASWAALQPPPSTALSAFAHRIGLNSILYTPDVIRQACTHDSYLSLFRKHYPNSKTTAATTEPKTNGQLAALGNSLMGMFAAEWVHARWPYLPTRVMKSVVTAHVGPPTCESVAREMGAAPLLRWHRTPATETDPPVLHADAMASIPRSLTALIYQERSFLDARKFVHAHFLSRQVDVKSMLKFRNPKTTLIELTKKFGRELPKSRLLSETGRFSNSPIFVAGVYSGADKLGEGFGSSLKMAEYRAAEDALFRVYLTRAPDESLQLPTSTFPSGFGGRALGVILPIEGEEGEYTAPELGPDTEVLYYSADRSGRSR